MRLLRAAHTSPGTSPDDVLSRQGMRRYIEAEDADIVILSETKMADPGFDWLNDRYPVSCRKVLSSDSTVR